MNAKFLHYICILFIVFLIPMSSMGNAEFSDPPKTAVNFVPIRPILSKENNKSWFSDTAILEDPITVQYLQRHLNKNTPRLILTPIIEKQLRTDVKNNPVIKSMYKAIQLNAQQIMREPLLKHIKTGKRLLAVSREMLYRMNVLGIIYAIDGNKKILNRINKEVVDVCDFKDWNPSHFLDVAEMSMAVAIALDWTKGNLPKSTTNLAQTALIEKGIKPSYEKGMWWINGTNNWNQVCNGGMIAASLAIAKKDPALAAKTISRSLKGIPDALKEYAPDGVYPEGPTYWIYGTTFSALTSSMLKSALGTDFGLSQYHPLMESANFYLLSIAPSGEYYNFSDCGLDRSEIGDITLSWFAQETGNPDYFPQQRFLEYSQNRSTLPRFAGAGLIWASLFEQENKVSKTPLPLDWKGDGPEPVVFFRGGKHDPNKYYFAAKGGQANHSHGNMDAGSFIFELDGVRWVIDPGTQDYYDIEKTGFDLWGMCQTCDRWKLLTKNNDGHSTLTVNGDLFNVNGFVKIVDYQKGTKPEVTFDMTPLYDGHLKNATRKFIKENDHSLLIEDYFETTGSTRLITWQLMTTANVETIKNGAILHEDGKQLKLEILSPSDITVSVISLDPPPLKIDKRIEDLKRIELRIPAWTFKNGKGTIKVMLSGS